MVFIGLVPTALLCFVASGRLESVIQPTATYELKKSALWSTGSVLCVGAVGTLWTLSYDTFLRVHLPECMSSLRLCEIYLLNFDSFHFGFDEKFTNGKLAIFCYQVLLSLLKKCRDAFHEVTFILFQNVYRLPHTRNNYYTLPKVNNL
jgi:hypothetical protein